MRRKRVYLGEIGGDLAIIGPDGEMVDLSEGRHFLYHFDESQRSLEQILSEGAARFAQRFGRLPTVVILSSTYGYQRGQLIVGLSVVPVAEIPTPHFWFGPKPDFYQARFDLE